VEARELVRAYAERIREEKENSPRVSEIAPDSVHFWKDLSGIGRTSRLLLFFQVILVDSTFQP
jgi:hypothetical protein